MELYRFNYQQGNLYDYDERKVVSELSYPPHQHEYFEMDLYLNGRGSVYVGNREYPLERGCISLVTPRDLHALDVIEDADTLHFAFTPDAVRDSQIYNILYKLESFSTVLDEEGIEYFSDMFRKFDEARKRDFGYKAMYLSHMFENILMEFIIRVSAGKNTGKSAGDKMPGNIINALNYINSNFLSDNISLEKVAEAGRVSKTHMSEIFHRYTGMTYNSYLLNLRLDYAEKLLLSNQLSITEISYMVGYNSTSSFLRAFKEKYKMSPKKYAEYIKSESN